MGQTHVPGATNSGNHHHGASETAIFVVSGTPVFVFVDLEGDEPVETRIQTGPGDYIFVPPYVPHREENPDPDTEAVVVIARTTQEAIVVNLDTLAWPQVSYDPLTHRACSDSCCAWRAHASAARICPEWWYAWARMPSVRAWASRWPARRWVRSARRACSKHRSMSPRCSAAAAVAACACPMATMDPDRFA
ncbi:cupin domain-containing protein [Phytohabitans rumicis]|uniref:cupin domain-containing protein n=1 Tax=Phytohabitans rumicis TaxID=1076125 RepID=UPI001FE453FA|nr:cupin domain-containing protein [Phytohabitans rumicis]